MSSNFWKFKPQHKGKPAHNRHVFSKDLIDKMGKISDSEIAKLAGVHRKTVEKFRKRNNISCYIPIGEKHGMSKLSNDDVYYVFKLLRSCSIKEIAKTMNVSYSTIWDIINNRSWKDYNNDKVSV